MKKLALLFICFMFVGGSFCSAEIVENKDNFTGGKLLISNTSCKLDMENKLKWFSLYKNINHNNVSYKLKASVTTYDKFTLSENKAEISLDTGNVFFLEVINRRDIPIDSKHNVAVNYEISQEVIQGIRESNRVALRFTQNNGSQFVYVLPDSVLAEWKQVIATKE